MISKEIQLSLSFCSALAAMLLSSAPVNEMTSLVGSGIAVLLSGGFFYGGISKYFADKKQGDQHMQDVIAASFKTLTDNQNQTGEQLKSVVKEVKILDSTLKVTLISSLSKYFADKEQRDQHMQDVIAASFKTLIDNQNQTGEQLKSVVEAIENLDYTLKFTLIGSLSKYFADKEQRDQHTQDVIAAGFKILIDNQNQTGEQLKAVVETIENLDDTLNGKLAEMSDTLSMMSDSVNRIKAAAGNIEENTGKIATLQKSAKSILDEISELSEGVGEISKVNEALRELMNAMDNQKEFYQTALNQYKGMTNKDYELIEMLARKLR